MNEDSYGYANGVMMYKSLCSIKCKEHQIPIDEIWTIAFSNTKRKDMEQNSQLGSFKELTN